MAWKLNGILGCIHPGFSGPRVCAACTLMKAGEPSRSLAEQCEAGELFIAPLQVHGCAVSVPGRALGGVIEGLRGGLSEEAFALLTAYHAGVVSLLKAGDSPEAAEKRAELLGRLPLLQAPDLCQTSKAAD